MSRARPIRGVVAAAVALLLVASAGPVRADDDEDVAALVRRGVDLRREHRNEEAVALFARAVALSAKPSVRAQLALAEQAAAHWIDAERDLDAALATKDDPWIAKNRAPLEEARAVVQKNLGWLAVDVDVAPADVRLDERTLPRATETRVVAGPHQLVVHADGYAGVDRRVVVLPEQHLRVAIGLAPLAAVAPPPPPAPTSAVRPADAAAPPPASSPPPAIPIAPIALAALGVAGLATGTYFGVRTINDKADREAACIGGCTPAALAAYSDGQTSSTISNIAFASGAALLTVGGIWWVVARNHAPVTAGVDVGPMIGAGARGIVVKGSL